MICFDLEGPLSPQDNAYEVMKLAKNGGKIFEALSQYDDVLALQGREGYEAGDTLKLIAPFLIYYSINERDIEEVSDRAKMVPGMKETVKWLKEQGFLVRIISTSYQQHAHTIGRQLGVSKSDIASTRLALDELSFRQDVMGALHDIESRLLSEGLSDETMKMLDKLYFSEGLFHKIGVEVIGGQRKVDALLKFAHTSGEELSEVAAVGDSITDYKMLEEVKNKAGLAIAFNANQYCLPYADVAIATVDGRALIPVMEGFKEGGREGAITVVDELEHDINVLEDGFSYLLDTDPRPHYANLEDVKGDIDEILKVHKDVRMKVRGEAGKLG
jgi:energy-converting hydrogenase A subunit R